MSLASFLNPTSAALGAQIPGAPVATGAGGPGIDPGLPGTNPSTGTGTGNGTTRPAGTLPPPPGGTTQPPPPPPPIGNDPAVPIPPPGTGTGGTVPKINLTPIASPTPQVQMYSDRNGNPVTLDQLIASWNTPVAATGTPTGTTSTIDPGAGSTSTDPSPWIPNSEIAAAPLPYATTPNTAGFTGPTLPNQGGTAISGSGGSDSVLSFDHGGVIDEPVIGRGQRTGKTYILVGNGKPEMVTPIASK